MRKKTTQEIERHYFNLFAKDYVLPSGVVHFGDKPDVILAADRKVGIEITNFFIASGDLSESEQRQGRRRVQAIAAAQTAYQVAGGKKFELTFSFDKDSPIHDVRDLSVRMASLATRIEGCASGSIDRSAFLEIPELAHAYVNANEYTDARWRLAQLHSAPMMSQSRLIEIVRDKERKALDYSPCDAYWLLIVVDFMDRAQDQEMRDPRAQGIPSETFEKIIIYRPHFRQIVEWGG